eukprot:SAG11_NODE_1396_length_5036_cov_2.382824_7_plen_127_part_00
MALSRRTQALAKKVRRQLPEGSGRPEDSGRDNSHKDVGERCVSSRFVSATPRLLPLGRVTGVNCTPLLRGQAAAGGRATAPEEAARRGTSLACREARAHTLNHGARACHGRGTFFLSLRLWPSICR